MKALALKIAALVGLTATAGFVRVNTTPSVPVGLYVAFGQPVKNGLVEFCPPDAIAEEGLRKGYIPRPGPCHGMTAWLVKELAAVPGDVVDVSPAGIAINGAMWPASARRYFAHDGTPIAQWIRYGRTRLAPDEVLVLGVDPESWDSRAWGPFKVSGRRWVRMFPLITWKGR